MIRTISSAMLLAATPLAAQAQTTGKWEVKVAPGECSLIRTVQGTAPALLAVRTIVGTDAYAVLLSAKDVPDHGKAESFPARLVFDGTTKLGENAAPLGKLTAGPAIQFQGLPPAMLGTFAKAQKIAAAEGPRNYAGIDIPKAPQAVAALRQCVADQLVEWGADPAQFAPGGTAPVALKDRDFWLTDPQVLKLAQGAGPGGIDYLFRVTIDTKGAIESCKRDTAGPSDKAEKLGCDPVLAQKLFTPAKNPAGVPVRGVATFRVTVTKVANQQ